MRTFLDDDGKVWIAEPREQSTPRHHGRWYLVFRAEDGSAEHPMTEVRWQTRASAERILATASDFELNRRLKNVRARFASNDGASDLEGEGRGVGRAPVGGNAG
jgi:hypothetical protein